MKPIEIANLFIIDQPVDAIDVVRQRSLLENVEDEAFYVCSVSDIIQKYRSWQMHMPRITPFYGNFSFFV